MKKPEKKRLVKKFHLKSHLFAEIYLNLFVITVNSLNSVRYKSEILPIKHAKPNQPTDFVRYNRVFVITKLDCTLKE